MGADRDRIGLEHHPRHDATGIDPQEGLDITRDPRAALGTDSARAVDVNHEARAVRLQGELALHHDHVQEVKVGHALGLEDGLVVGEDDRRGVLRTGNGIARLLSDAARLIDDAVGRAAEVDGRIAKAGGHVDVEYQIPHVGGEPLDADHPGARQGRVGGRVDAEAERRCIEHEHAAEIKVVHDEAGGRRIGHRAIDPAGVGIPAPIPPHAHEGPHIGHRDAQRRDADLPAIGERHLLPAALGQGQRARHLDGTGEVAIEIAHLRRDHFLAEVEHDRMGGIAGGDFQPGAAGVEGGALQVEGRHRQHGDRRLVEAGHANGGEGRGDGRRVARVNLDAHVARRGREDVVGADDRCPADLGLGGDVDRQDGGHARDRDAADARRGHDRQTEADILDLDADPFWLGAGVARDRRPGEAAHAGATDLDRIKVVGQAGDRDAGDGLQEPSVGLRAEDLAAGLDGQ